MDREWMRSMACDECGKVYNPVLRDRFWRGHFVDGDEIDVLCDDCKDTLDATRTPEQAPA